LKYWKPKTSLEEGIKLMCQYYQNTHRNWNEQLLQKNWNIQIC
jgi:dTDP-D-glucose 4,6-dehydratase